METVIKPIKITRKNFTEFGDLISSEDINPIDINAGYAKRFDNLANINYFEKWRKDYSKYFFSSKKELSNEN